MKPKTLILLAVAGGCGLVAMLGIQQAMQGGQANAAPKVRVLLAKMDIPASVPLTEDLVGFTELPQDAVPEDAVTSFEQYEERGLRYPAAAGDIIRQSKLGEKGEFTNSRQIPAGMRVVSIPVNETQTLAGMLQPGDRVDVLVTYKMRNARGAQTTKTTTLLKYVEVFATDARTASDGVTNASAQNAAKTKTVSLQVTPKQVNFIKLAESKGTLALSWRNPDDDEDVLDGEVDDSLFSELSGLDNINQAEPLMTNRMDEEEQPGSRDASQFLDEEEQAAPEEVTVVSPNAWNMQIFQGDILTEVSVELPEDQAEEADANSTSQDATGQDESLNGFFQTIQNQFIGGENQGPAPQATTESITDDVPTL